MALHAGHLCHWPSGISDFFSPKAATVSFLKKDMA
jgi:hypothetical protein